MDLFVRRQVWRLDDLMKTAQEKGELIWNLEKMSSKGLSFSTLWHAVHNQSASILSCLNFKLVFYGSCNSL